MDVIPAAMKSRRIVVSLLGTGSGNETLAGGVYWRPGEGKPGVTTSQEYSFWLWDEVGLNSRGQWEMLHAHELVSASLNCGRRT